MGSGKPFVDEARAQYQECMKILYDAEHTVQSTTAAFESLCTLATSVISDKNTEHAAQTLLRVGMHLNDQTVSFANATPLMVAAEYSGRPDTVKYLLNQRADPTLCNRLHVNALSVACFSGCLWSSYEFNKW